MEFKRLSDVEVVAEPLESANVLIEENGVIKKAPKTAVGGAKSEWDAVITIDNIYEISNDTVRFNEGSFDTILAKINADEVPKVKIIAYWDYGDVMKACVEPVSCEYNITVNGIDIHYVVNWGKIRDICIYSNGNIYSGNVSA